MRPFPQFKTGTKDLPTLWLEYRQRMTSEAGVAVYVFGNKLDSSKIIDAPGVRQEYEIAKEQGVVSVPIGATGFMAEQLYNEVFNEYSTTLFKQEPKLDSLYSILGDSSKSESEIIQSVIQIINKLQE